MKNFNKNKTEQVEVMALFGYEMTPCQPLTFRRRGQKETEVTELLRPEYTLRGKRRCTFSTFWLVGSKCDSSSTRVICPGISHGREWPLL